MKAEVIEVNGFDIILILWGQTAMDLPLTFVRLQKRMLHKFCEMITTNYSWWEHHLLKINDELMKMNHWQKKVSHHYFKIPMTIFKIPMTIFLYKILSTDMNYLYLKKVTSIETHYEFVNYFSVHRACIYWSFFYCYWSWLSSLNSIRSDLLIRYSS